MHTHNPKHCAWWRVLALAACLTAACSNERSTPAGLGSSAQTSSDCGTAGLSRSENGEFFWLDGKPVEFGWELEGNLWGILHLYRPNRMSPAGADAYALSLSRREDVDINASELTDEIWLQWSLPRRIEYIGRYLIRDPAQPPEPANPLNIAWDHFVRLKRMPIAGYENVSHILTLDSVANWETHAAQPTRSLRDWARQTNALEVLMNQSELRLPSESPDGDPLGMFFHAWASFDRGYALNHADRTLVIGSVLARLNAETARQTLRDYPLPAATQRSAYPRYMESPLFARWHGMYPGDYDTLVAETLSGATQYKRAYVALRNLVSDATGEPQRFMGSNRVAFEFRTGVTSAAQQQLLGSTLDVLIGLTTTIEELQHDEERVNEMRSVLTGWVESTVDRMRAALSAEQWKALVGIAASVASLDQDLGPDDGAHSSYQPEDLVSRLALPLLPWETGVTPLRTNPDRVLQARNDYMQQLGSLLDQFAQLPDPTVGQGLEHAMRTAHFIQQWAVALGELEASQ